MGSRGLPGAAQEGSQQAHPVSGHAQTRTGGSVNLKNLMVAKINARELSRDGGFVETLGDLTIHATFEDGSSLRVDLRPDSKGKFQATDVAFALEQLSKNIREKHPYNGL